MNKATTRRMFIWGKLRIQDFKGIHMTKSYIYIDNRMIENTERLFLAQYLPGRYIAGTQEGLGSILAEIEPLHLGWSHLSYNPIRPRSWMSEGNELALRRIYQLIEAQNRFPPFHRRNFRMHFL